MNRDVVISKLETKAKRKIVISDIHGNLRVGVVAENALHRALVENAAALGSIAAFIQPNALSYFFIRVRVGLERVRSTLRSGRC